MELYIGIYIVYSLMTMILAFTAFNVPLLYEEWIKLYPKRYKRYLLLLIGGIFIDLYVWIGILLEKLCCIKYDPLKWFKK